MNLLSQDCLTSEEWWALRNHLGWYRASYPSLRWHHQHDAQSVLWVESTFLPPRCKDCWHGLRCWRAWFRCYAHVPARQTKVRRGDKLSGVKIMDNGDSFLSFFLKWSLYSTLFQTSGKILYYISFLLLIESLTLKNYNNGYMKSYLYKTITPINVVCSIKW